MSNDPSAAKVRRVARLSQKDARSETGLFLLEGPQGLKEAVAYPELIDEVFFTTDARDALAREFELLADAGVELTEVSEQALKQMADTNTPQGVVAVCRQLDVAFEDLLESRPLLVAFLANVRDPGNAGTILRAADAAGADAVIFSDSSVDLYNPKLVRSTAGSLFHVPVVIGVDIQQAIAELKATGIQVFAANGGGQALPLPQDELAKPTAWVLG
ncbi:MAG: TrmH family RNA methyltransferase, partial [Micrococcales bacterium]